MKHLFQYHYSHSHMVMKTVDLFFLYYLPELCFNDIERELKGG